MEYVTKLNLGILKYGEKWGEYSILNILSKEPDQQKREKIIIELIIESNIPLKIVIIGCIHHWTPILNTILSNKSYLLILKGKLDEKFFNESAKSVVKCCFLCNKFIVFDWLKSNYPHKSNFLMTCIKDDDKWLDDIEKMESKNSDLLPSSDYFTKIKKFL